MPVTAHDKVLQALAKAGTATTMDLGSASGVGQDQARRAVHQLVGKGFATRESPHGAAQITADGRARAEALTGRQTSAAAAGAARFTTGQSGSTEDRERRLDNGIRMADVDAAIAPLPEPHKAMIRLLLRSTAARMHLGHRYRDGHMGGIGAGDHGTGKTLTGQVVRIILGLPEDAYRYVPSEADGSLWARRKQLPGGQWAIDLTAALSYPFIILDEADHKARKHVREAALRHLHGDAQVAAEGHLLPLPATAYATCNDALDTIDSSYRRRNACMDLTGWPKLATAVARQVVGALPRLQVEQLPPPVTALPAAIAAELDSALQRALTPEGYALCNIRGLEMAAICGAGLNGSADLEAAAVEVARDMLTLAQTTGHLATCMTSDQETVSIPAQAGPDSLAEAFLAENNVRTAVGSQLAAFALLKQDVLTAFVDCADAGCPVPQEWLIRAEGFSAGVDHIRDALAALKRKAATEQDLARLTLAITERERQGNEILGQVRYATAGVLAVRAAEKTARLLEAEREKRLAIQASRPLALPAPPAAPPLTRKERDARTMANIRALRNATSKRRERRPTQAPANAGAAQIIPSSRDLMGAALGTRARSFRPVSWR